jgi:hypothetical protein
VKREAGATNPNCRILASRRYMQGLLLSQNSHVHAGIISEKTFLFEKTSSGGRKNSQKEKERFRDVLGKV